METISSMNPLRPLNLQRSSIYLYLYLSLYLYIYLYLFILFLFVFLFLSLPLILPYSRPFILVTVAFFLQTEMIDRMTRYARVREIFIYNAYMIQFSRKRYFRSIRGPTSFEICVTSLYSLGGINGYSVEIRTICQ